MVKERLHMEELNGLSIIALSKEAAEAHFDLMKEEYNFQLRQLQHLFPDLSLHLNAKSLQEFERLYFDIYKYKRKEHHLSRPQFEVLLSYYMQKLFVENRMASWHIGEVDERQYNLGVRYGFGTITYEVYARDLISKTADAPLNLYNHFMSFVPDDLKDLI